ncbi:putative alpha-glucosidase [Apostichopus japonicus]|uniref:Putative alpha-glucosidase n=1 Tax=Stichopus japonicus TaxID=307972 RepID=A0A2G8JSY8_STIJA|nr:putative alpha-glucosidase [Apostichopus japonicus]
MKLPTVLIVLFLLGCTSAKDFAWNEWWKNTIIYQIYPRSFQDSDDDGVGDLQGITSRLSHFRDINVGCIWISPIFQSPFADFGYDVSDFTAIDPLFGTMEDFEELLATAKNLGIRVILDFVPNHSSDKHMWFNESAESRNYANAYRDYYMWQDPRAGCQLENPEECYPNNWVSVFGGPMWEWNENRQQFYLHQFLKEQPDLNLRNPIVQQNMKDAVAFWMEKGIDGYRLDAIYHSFEVPSLEDEPENPDYVKPINQTQEQYDSLIHTKTTRLPEVHTMLRDWRKTIFEPNSVESQDRYMFMVTEAYDPPEDLVEYYGTDEEAEADFPFNFQLISFLTEENLSGQTVYDLVNPVFVHLPEGRWPNWVVGNHDNFRISDRLGAKYVRAINTLNLLLPGTATTYYGEELGMENIYVSYEDTQDPFAKNNPCCWEEYTRDPERSPMQWDGQEKNAGFSNADETWLPVNENYQDGINVAEQKSDSSSTLNHYATLASMRTTTSAFQTNHLTYAMVDEDIFAFFRFPDEEDASDAVYLVAINFGDGPVTRNFVTAAENNGVDLPETGDIRISTGMDKNDQSADLTDLTLASGEALVIEVEASKLVEPTATLTPTPTPDGASQLGLSALLLVTSLVLFFSVRLF